MTALGEARQAVFRDRLPRRSVGRELADARADPRILIERPHADADRIGVAGVAAEQRRAAVAAEPLLVANSAAVAAAREREVIHGPMCVGAARSGEDALELVDDVEAVHGLVAERAARRGREALHGRDMT